VIFFSINEDRIESEKSAETIHIAGEQWMCLKNTAMFTVSTVSSKIEKLLIEEELSVLFFKRLERHLE